MPAISNSASGKLILITGTGHCGTQWLSHVLYRPAQGIVCYHEKKRLVMDRTWQTIFRHEFEKGLDQLFDVYWDFLREQLKTYQVVGDSNSWTACMLPEVTKHINVDQVIFLVRNGIQTVHSSFYHNTAWPRDDWFYTDYIHRYWQIMGQPGGDWSNYTDWATWCLWWQTNEFMPKWVADQLGADRVLVYRLEDLVNDVELLMELIYKLNPHIEISREHLEVEQQTDVNRKIQGDRSPEALWKKWTDEQRQVFRDICGSGMSVYNYPIPPRP